MYYTVIELKLMFILKDKEITNKIHKNKFLKFYLTPLKLNSCSNIQPILSIDYYYKTHPFDYPGSFHT